MMSRSIFIEDGAALISVVWAVFLLSLLATSVMVVTLDARRLVEHVGEERQQLLDAEAAMTVFVKQHFYDAEQRAFLIDTVEAHDQEFTVQVTFESGKINLNRAPTELLSALFLVAGANEETARELAGAVIDWRDEDQDLSPYGAEWADYDAEGVGYGPRDGPFESIGELRHVLGVDESLFLCVRPLLTVSSLSPSVDMNFASQSVKSVFQWAHDTAWEGLSWPDPATTSQSGDIILEEHELVGKAMTLTVTRGGQEGLSYSAMIRFKTASDNSYAYLKPIRAAIAPSTVGDCGF